MDSSSPYPHKPFPGSSHSWALERARALGPGPLRVLDVGAGAGHVLAAVRAARADPIEACAVEPTDAGAGIEDARWVRSLEEVEEDGFDLALALDVLEHVPEPTAFLARIAAMVRPGGAILLSVPNVAHWSMRASLLLGRFDYQERGILDRTHLRFFTRRSLEQLIEDAGLSRVCSGEAIVPLELLLPEAAMTSALWAASTSARRALARAWPGLLGYQLLAEASPKDAELAPRSS